MRKFLCFVLLAVSFTEVTADSIQARLSMPMSACAHHLPYGSPQSNVESLTLICREGYALQYDNTAKIPTWVAYTLTPEKALGCYPRVSNFRRDPSIPEGFSSSTRDYAKTGFDIGHMVSSADMRWSALAEVESNVLSNVAPQNPGLNRGAWRSLETLVRIWVIHRSSPVLIYVGPIYDVKNPTMIGENQVAVPMFFYKIVIDQQTGEILSFLYPNQDSNAPPNFFRTSLLTIQGLSKIHFPLPAKFRLSPDLWAADTRAARFVKTKTCIEEQTKPRKK